MRVKKTKQSDRGVYRYPVQVEDGRGGYRTAYNVIKPGEDGNYRGNDQVTPCNG